MSAQAASMSEIDRRVLEALGDEPMSETGVVDALAGWRTVHPEMVSGALRRLLLAGIVGRDGPKWKQIADKPIGAVSSNVVGLPIAGLEDHKECVECHGTFQLEAFKKVVGGRITDVCLNCHRKKCSAGIAKRREHDPAWGRQRKPTEEQDESTVAEGVGDEPEEEILDAEQMPTNIFLPEYCRVGFGYVLVLYDRSHKNYRLELSGKQIMALYTQLSELILGPSEGKDLP